MEFYDCNAAYGIPLVGDALIPAHSVRDLHTEMVRAGVSGGLVWRLEQHVHGSPNFINRSLSEDLADQERLHGIWTILPACTGEIDPPRKLIRKMKKNRIAGWRLCPENFRFMAKPFVLKDWFEAAVEYRIPVFINTLHGTSLEQTADLLTAFPGCTVVLTYKDTTPNDRLLRPFIESFPNLYLDTTYWFQDGCIEDFVRKYGAERLLYGSGFPYSYFGANMMMIIHAEITGNDKELIAGGNLRRIMTEVRYD
jgi:hypothetical protein